jgi:hypothetical protein
VPRAKHNQIRVITGNGRNAAYRARARWPCSGGISPADCFGALIVSVEVTEFAPGVTEFEEKEQVASGVDPVTTQDS